MTTTRQPSTQTSEKEALQAELEETREHLANTVQELSRQLNVPRRMKESVADARQRAVQAVTDAGQRAKQAVGGAGQRAAVVTGDVRVRAKQAVGGAGQRAAVVTSDARVRAKQAAGGTGSRALVATGAARDRAKQLPELSRRHPRAAAAVGGAMALGVGAAAWIAGRSK